MHKFVTEFPYQPIQFNPRKAHMNRKLSHMKPRWKNAQHSSYTYTIVSQWVRKNKDVYKQIY